MNESVKWCTFLPEKAMGHEEATQTLGLFSVACVHQHPLPYTHTPIWYCTICEDSYSKNAKSARCMHVLEVHWTYEAHAFTFVSVTTVMTNTSKHKSTTHQKHRIRWVNHQELLQLSWWSGLEQQLPGMPQTGLWEQDETWSNAPAKRDVRAHNESKKIKQENSGWDWSKLEHIPLKVETPQLWPCDCQERQLSPPYTYPVQRSFICLLISQHNSTYSGHVTILWQALCSRLALRNDSCLTSTWQDLSASCKWPVPRLIQ